MPTTFFLIEYTKETQNPLSHGQSVSDWLQTVTIEGSEHADTSSPKCIVKCTGDESSPDSIEKTVKSIWKSKKIKETSCYMLLGLTDATQDEATPLSTGIQTSETETTRVTLYATTFEFNGALRRYRFTAENQTPEKIQENIMGSTPGTLQDCTLFETLKALKQTVCVRHPLPYLEIFYASDPDDASEPTIHTQEEPCPSREIAINRVKALLTNEEKDTPKYSVIFHAEDETSHTLLEPVVVTIKTQLNPSLREVTFYASDREIGLGIDNTKLQSIFFIAEYLKKNYPNNMKKFDIDPRHALSVSAASLTTHLIMHGPSAGQISYEEHNSRREALFSAISHTQRGSPYTGFALENAHTKSTKSFSPVKLLIKQADNSTVEKYHLLFSHQRMHGFVHMKALKTFQAFREAAQQIGINLSEEATVVITPPHSKFPRVILSSNEKPRIIEEPQTITSSTGAPSSTARRNNNRLSGHYTHARLSSTHETTAHDRNSLAAEDDQDCAPQA